MQQIRTDGVLDSKRLGGIVDPLGNRREIEIWPYEQMVYAAPSISPVEWDAQTPLELWDTNGSSNIGLMAKP